MAEAVLPPAIVSHGRAATGPENKVSENPYFWETARNAR